MIRATLALGAVLGMAACGGGSQNVTRGYGSPSLYATGPIQKACAAQDRRAATATRCGCVQAVANRELSASDQRRAVRYFKDPHALQEVRQNQDNNASNKRFWAAWKAYGQQAARTCS